MASPFTLGKKERLKSRKQTELLFKDGKRFMSGNLRIYYHYNKEGEHGLQFGAGTSTKLFRRAVDRNRIKRLIRESYRLQKGSLQENVLAKQKQLTIFFLYTGKEMPVYHQLYELAGKAIAKLDIVLKEMQ